LWFLFRGFLPIPHGDGAITIVSLIKKTFVLFLCFVHDAPQVILDGAVNPVRHDMFDSACDKLDSGDFALHELGVVVVVEDA